MPMKGQPIKSIKYPRYSLEANAIGLFRDDISVLKNAIKYMKRG